MNHGCTDGKWIGICVITEFRKRSSHQLGNLGITVLQYSSRWPIFDMGFGFVFLVFLISVIHHHVGWKQSIRAGSRSQHQSHLASFVGSWLRKGKRRTSRPQRSFGFSQRHLFLQGGKGGVGLCVLWRSCTPIGNLMSEAAVVAGRAEKTGHSFTPRRFTCVMSYRVLSLRERVFLPR